MVRELDVEVALAEPAEHGEGPIWDVDRGVLHWVDILAGGVHTFDPASGRDVVRTLDQQVGAIALRDDGSLLVAAERGLGVLDPDDPGPVDARTTVLDVVVPIEPGRPDLRANDGAADPHGRYWIGTMAHDDRVGAGTLYRVDEDGSVHPQLTDLTVSNGLAWAPDGATAWFIDSPTRRVDRLLVDPDTGDLLERRPWLDLSDAPGVPDGMTIDAEGGLWIALWGGREVRRHDPDGRLDVVVAVPCDHPTSCALGGPDLDRLFVTSSRRDLDDAARREQPHAGALFTREVDVPGVPCDRAAV